MRESIRDRYVSFKNIDCYENASVVLDAMCELFESEPKSKNAFWIRFMEMIPQDYKEVFSAKEHKDTLYQVCSNLFYIYDLFEEYDFESGIIAMELCELECC
ncbi:MAG: N(2)-fixation sustaining protein CowN [Campylobacterales bacterium]|nr:N(2)-fixation sustaining protein CowN [Campylobacterales bacterium]